MKKIIFTLIFISFGIVQNVMAQEDCGIAHYEFNNNANNTISNNYHGLVNGVSSVDDMDGNTNSAYAFNATSSYIELNNNQSVINSENFTITAWAKMDGAGGGVNGRNPLFVQRNSVVNSTSSNASLFAQYVDDKVTFIVRNQSSGGVVSVVGDVIDFGEWHFYAAVKDSTSISLYVDSVLVGSTPYTASGLYNSGVNTVDIGRHFYSGTPKSYFNGTIDEVRIFDCALSEEEIQDIYQPIKTPPLSVVENTNDLISLYPNPVLNVLNIQSLTEQSQEYHLYSSTGVFIQSGKIQGDLSIDVSNLPQSTYYITVLTGKDSQVYKFVKIE